MGPGAIAGADFTASVIALSGTFCRDCRFAGTFNAGVKWTPRDSLCRRAPGTRDAAEFVGVDAQHVLDLEGFEPSHLGREVGHRQRTLFGVKTQGTRPLDRAGLEVHPWVAFHASQRPLPHALDVVATRPGGGAAHG